MKKFFLAAFLVSSFVAGQTATYTPSPTPTVTPTPRLWVNPAALVTPGADCLSSTARCSFSTAKAKITPGDTVQLGGTTGPTASFSDGHYTASSDMIVSLPVSGTATKQIFIVCQTSNACLIDGGSVQGVETGLAAFNINGRSYFVIDGLDVCCSGGQATGQVVGVTAGASNNILRRIIAWDAPGHYNASVYNIDGSGTTLNNLFDTIAGFGNGRKIFVSHSGTTAGVTQTAILRNAIFIMDGGNVNAGPHHVLSHNYNAHGLTSMDVVMMAPGDKAPTPTWTLYNNGCKYVAYTGECDSGARIGGGSACANPVGCSPSTYPPGWSGGGSKMDQPIGMNSTDGSFGQTFSVNSYGAISIVRSGDVPGLNYANYFTGACGITLADAVAAYAQGAPNFTPYQLGNHSTGCSPTALSRGNLTDINGPSNSIGTDWVQQAGTSTTHLPDKTTFSYATAGVRYFHNADGTLSNQARWPVNPTFAQSISDARVYAGYPAVNLNADIQEALGTFPDGSAATATPTLTATIGTPTATKTPTSSTPSPTPTVTPTMALCARHFRYGSASRIWRTRMTLCFDGVGNPSPDWVTLATPTPTP